MGSLLPFNNVTGMTGDSKRAHEIIPSAAFKDWQTQEHWKLDIMSQAGQPVNAGGAADGVPPLGCEPYLHLPPVPERDNATGLHDAAVHSEICVLILFFSFFLKPLRRCP